MNKKFKNGCFKISVIPCSYMHCQIYVYQDFSSFPLVGNITQEHYTSNVLIKKNFT